MLPVWILNGGQETGRKHALIETILSCIMGNGR